jgi:hypothetical protein
MRRSGRAHEELRKASRKIRKGSYRDQGVAMKRSSRG